MAETAVTEPPLYPKLTGMIAYTLGMEAVREGVPYRGHPLLPIERPELFGRTQSPVRNGAMMPNPSCWTCGETFTPKQTGQRYCGAECRRMRERELSRAIRITNRVGKPADIPRGADVIAELEIQQALVRKLIYNLGGWIESREDVTVDEIALEIPDPSSLVGKAKIRYGELTKFINDERHRLKKEPPMPGMNVDPRTEAAANQRQLTERARVAAWNAYAATLGGN
ncbi:hypothetical protein [Actinoplanes sp. G11-F43]|uniref:hypothetical protein n=1 Tax=Actinoplanes sp. G11-F43 TaxID=3424130 RepID=UPI003D34137A